MAKNVEDLKPGDVVEITTKAWVRIERIEDAKDSDNAFRGNTILHYSGATLDDTEGEYRIGSKVGVEVLD